MPAAKHAQQQPMPLGGTPHVCCPVDSPKASGLCISGRQVLLVHPVTTLLMMGTVAAVIVFLVGGELWILSLRFNECAAAQLCLPSATSAVPFMLERLNRHLQEAGGPAH
jgi:hypothetical protein